MLETHYFFIDECGDPEFYGKRKKLLVGTEGFQPLLILGMVETPNRKTLQKAILELKAEILSDPLYNTIYSVSQPDWYFHARTDHSDIRHRFFQFLRQFNPSELRFHAIIGRKDLGIFNRKHNNNPSEFYIVDYFLWALQRYLLKGEIRFWQSIEPLAGEIVDLYGEGAKVYDGETHLLRLDKLKPPLNL